MFTESLLNEIRSKFHHIDLCPYQGPRAYFENAGGSLTLKKVVEVNTQLSSIPDNQGRDNPASHELESIIEQGRKDMMMFFGAQKGQVIMGESGTELLFRLIRAVALNTQEGEVLGSTLEHPATASASKHWAKASGKTFVEIVHDKETVSVTANDYKQHITDTTRVALIIQTSPVSGMSVDIKAIIDVIRSVSPQCFIIVDGIQHAAHGSVDVSHYDIDAYAVSAYKMYSKHNYGLAWISPRLSLLEHDHIDGSNNDFWELGTRDTSAFATFSEVVNYLSWLGSNFTQSFDVRERLVAAGKAMNQQEMGLVNALINGVDGLNGLKDYSGIYFIAGCELNDRAGVVSFTIKGRVATEVVRLLSAKGIRVHARKNDHYSGNILNPLNIDSCVRVSVCHYNSIDEIKLFLSVTTKLLSV